MPPDPNPSASHVLLLTEATNWAVVHLPGRAFPGVVIQGDSLNTLLHELIAIRKRATRLHDSELDLEIDEVIDRLQRVLDSYKSVLKREGMELPFSEPK